MTEMYISGCHYGPAGYMLKSLFHQVLVKNTEDVFEVILTDYNLVPLKRPGDVKHNC